MNLKEIDQNGFVFGNRCEKDVTNTKSGTKYKVTKNILVFNNPDVSKLPLLTVFAILSLSFERLFFFFLKQIGFPKRCWIFLIVL